MLVFQSAAMVLQTISSRQQRLQSNGYNVWYSDKFGMMCLATVENQYLGGGAGLICGEKTASQIDEEVLSIITERYNEAYKMLEENREILDRISEYLCEKETITGKEFMKVYCEMKGLPYEESGQCTSDRKVRSSRY